MVDQLPARRRILVVDDERDITSALQAVLELYGYEVSVARDGQEALRLLQHHDFQPDLILLDLMMPVLNGWEFRELQLADERLAAIPVVVLTGGGNIRDHAQALGVQDALAKPTDIDTLLGVIQRYVGE